MAGFLAAGAVELFQLGLQCGQLTQLRRQPAQLVPRDANLLELSGDAPELPLAGRALAFGNAKLRHQRLHRVALELNALPLRNEIVEGSPSGIALLQRRRHASLGGPETLSR